MKPSSFIVLLLVGASVADGVQGADRTITKVVKLLQKMLDQSKADADADNIAYAKYKCYVDKNEAEKTASVKKLTGQISLLESKISELQARNGELSGQTAALDRDMSENKASQKAATTIRTNGAKAFKAMEEDLTKGIAQMSEAISVLNSIALQQNQASVQKKKAVLLSLSTSQALSAASALLTPDKRAIMESFLQAPLTAASSSKGDAIVGILKSLKSTFEGNLKNAQDSEAAEKKAFDDSVDTLESSWTKMDKSTKDKKQEMGDNDGELGTKKTQYDEAKKQKAEDEDFLEKLTEMATKKAKNYEERKMLRVNEDAAIAECISILNSDAAFSTFGDVSATKTGKTSFLQMRRKLRGGATEAEAVLELAASQGHSSRLARIAQSMRTGHAFTNVLAEIEKMKTTISEEGAADQENLSWCKKERKNSDADLTSKKDQIKTLNSAIDSLEETIDDPASGLKVQISEKEVSLIENQKAQTDQTKTRNGENAAYQKDVRNLSDAEDILARAVQVLKNYYTTLEKHMKDNKDSTNFVQKADPAPPKTYDDFGGQKSEGNQAVTMLEFILTETKKEHTAADSTEETAQSDFDASMTKLKKAETDMGTSLVKLKSDLADKEKELLEKNSDLKDTTAAKEALESYLQKIKPGCDFITTNFDLRDKNRATETAALEKAVTLIKDTPAYKDAVARDKALADGKCKTQCKLDTTNLGCKACMAGSTKADYCTANAGFPGCK